MKPPGVHTPSIETSQTSMLGSSTVKTDFSPVARSCAAASVICAAWIFVGRVSERPNFVLPINTFSRAMAMACGALMVGEQASARISVKTATKTNRTAIDTRRISALPFGGLHAAMELQSMAWNATAHRQRRTWASRLCAQSVLLEKVTSLATDTAVVGVRVLCAVCHS